MAQNLHLRVLMLTWEYPPRIIGGISRVVEGLSKALVNQSHEVHIITPEMPGTLLEDNDHGVFIHRVPIETPTPTFQAWTMMMNHYFAKRVGRLVKETGDFDIVHAHDWLVLPAAAETKAFCNTCLVSTLHSLEYKRSGGIQTPETSMTESLEWWLTYESSQVTVCSNSMKEDTVTRFRVPESKISIIPIGVNSEKYKNVHPNRDQVRLRYGISSDETMVLFVGRLTRQKGCEYLINAIPQVPRRLNAKLVVVGDGSLRSELETLAVSAGISKIMFAGFVSEKELDELYLSSDLLVIPSVYEPFGVVALEAMAAGLPVVASNVDGLGEIIIHDFNGVLAYPRDSSSIAWGITKVLSDENNTRRLIENAKLDIRSRFSWDAVARKTVEIYLKAITPS
ncbi:MAG: glycosyltransferase family 4 protein [Nitrososphaerota archaeon]|nr:glycosyltransferase family 4 protein [Nitrososphaerota archaeon]